MLEVKLIGTFDIQCDGKPVTISSRAAQSLFAYLIINAGISHRREKLAGMFWPDVSEEKARAYLRHELWLIRKAFSSKSKSDTLITDDLNIAFNASAEYWLDAAALESASESASIEELMTALSVFHGELLPGFYDDWVTQEREHLQSIFEQKITRLLETLEGAARWNDILEWAERWISHGQGSEAAYRYLMIAYDALGERAKVTSTYERCVQVLRELDLEPSEQTRALAFKRTHSLNIPIPLTSFIGREKELKEVADLLSKSRLVTLTGAGGVGKTRLSIQVVAEVLDRFPDGVWFLDLAPLSDPALVPYTLVNLLGLRQSGEIPLTEMLINYFRTRTALLIFDNCEHLIESCAQLVNSLLISCKALSILATSREALRVSGEIHYRVPSLAIPKPDIEFTIDEFSNMDSVRLFAERAAVISSGFAISLQNVAVIAQICQRLDGIPLAIELAVARINTLTVEQISNRLDDRFNLLTGGLRSALPRHQTLRAMIEWSYDLLSERERILFRRLAVFAGGWTLEAAEEVCSEGVIKSNNVLDLLSHLVNKSLVVVETIAGKTRYHMLETLRQFALEKLVETAEATQLQDRHRDYFLNEAEEIEPYLMGSEQSSWMDYLESELDNMRLALEWSISNKRGDESLRLFGALAALWYGRCHFREGVKWFRRALELRDKASKTVQANALRHAGSLYFAQDDFSASRTVLRESLNLYRQLGDMKEISTGLQFLGVLEVGQGDFVRARPLLEEGLTISREVNNKPAMIRALINLAYISHMEGDDAIAHEQYKEGLAICRQIQDSHLLSLVLQNLGEFVFTQKNYTKAREYYEETLAICLKLKNKRTIAYALFGFAEIFCAEFKNSQSAQLQGFVLTLLNGFITETDLRALSKNADNLKAAIGDSYWKEFEIGKTLRLEQAVEIALKQER